MQNSLTRWVLSAFSVLLLVSLGSAPVLAQSGGSAESSAKTKKLNQLKKSFSRGLKAAKSGNHSQAYNQLEQALQLARDTEQGGAENQIMGYLQKLPKNWGNKAIENKDYEQALTHFDKGVTHAEDDAYMHYGKGLALINLDNTEAGLETLKQAIEVGNRTGNTRVTGLATDRIRDEFLARASKALNVENPSAAQADRALTAIEDMEQYVEPNAKALFYRARALFEKRQYSDAISVAEQALDRHQGSRSDAAKYHFIVAESQMKLGNKNTACQTFQRATFGDYKARAEHYLKNECE
jgi:tetratricopeptide (TPR) repeat protein